MRTSIDRRSYSFATDLLGSNGSLADALRNIPGAGVDLNGNLTIRSAAVQIMIDGQPSQFTGPQGGQVLQTMPADRIDRVEVINNPSAAFSPEGGGGIINLVTKKAAPSGVSGGLRANAGTSGHDNVAGNFIYQKDKLTLQGDAGWSVNRQKYRISTTGTVTDPVTGQADPRTQYEITNPPNLGLEPPVASPISSTQDAAHRQSLRYPADGGGDYFRVCVCVCVCVCVYYFF